MFILFSYTCMSLYFFIILQLCQEFVLSNLKAHGRLVNDAFFVVTLFFSLITSKI